MCYLIAALQVLFSIKPIREWLLKSNKLHLGACKDTIKKLKVECEFCIFALTLIESLEKTGSTMEPSLIFGIVERILPKMEAGTQQDAMECFSKILEIFQKYEKLQIISDNPPKPLPPLFSRTDVDQLSCLDGHQKTILTEDITVLDLHITESASVSKAIVKYGESTVLKDYKCPGCPDKSGKRTTKQTLLMTKEPPGYLVIQLNIFMPGKTKFKEKIVVDELLTIDNSRYRLHAMINHIGETLDEGHFISLVRDSTGQFLKYDDSRIESVSILLKLKIINGHMEY
jgi:ubiquitin C-terminal hydrolase